MSNNSDKSKGVSDSSERLLIDSAWAQFEALAAGRKPPLSGVRHSLVIPGYRILQEIHRGGQGIVYQAIQESTQRKVAIKVLKEGPLADLTELARFDREVDVLSRLNHPNIVAIHDRGMAAEHAYYVMDYIPGQPLDAHVTGAALLTRHILALFHKVCAAVNIAHLRGVIHRDLKPSNIRVDEEGQPHVLDFGLAKLAQDTGSSADTMTLTGQFIGSLPWASPEQAEGRSDLLDVRTDVYSLGVILYQLLTRRFPYPVSGRMTEVVQNIIHVSPARPSTLVRDIDRDVEIILLKCLEKEPERRYQSAGELARDIQRFMNEEPIEARPATSLYQLRQFSRRNKALVASVIAIIVVLCTATTVSVAFGLREAAARDRERLALEREVEQRQRANSEAQSAQVARRLAEQRAEETRQVADFQASMLRGLDADALGRGIHDEFRKQLRAALGRQQVGKWPDRRPRTDGQVDAALEVFDTQTSSLSSADVARRVLDEFVLARASDSLGEQFCDQPLVQAEIHDALGASYRALGLLDAAESHYRQALTIHRREMGDELKIALDLNNVAAMMYYRGEFADAEPLCREALAIQRNQLGDQHPAIAQTLHYLGSLLHGRGDLAAAEILYREALAMARKTLGDEHIDVAETMNNLAGLLYNRGDLSGAETLFRETLALRRKLLGEEHPQVAPTLQNLAAVMQDKGELAAAEQMFREVLAIRRRHLGNQHPDLATTLCNLGVLLKNKGEYDEAESLNRECLAIRRNVFGDEHVDVAGSMNNLAALLRDRGDYAAAEPLYREAIAMLERILPSEHWKTAGSRAGLARVLLKSSADAGLALDVREVRLAEAESLLLSAERDLSSAEDAPATWKKRVLETLIELCEIRDVDAPDRGYDAKAAQWKARLREHASKP